MKAAIENKLSDRLQVNDKATGVVYVLAVLTLQVCLDLNGMP